MTTRRLPALLALALTFAAPALAEADTGTLSVQLGATGLDQADRSWHPTLRTDFAFDLVGPLQAGGYMQINKGTLSFASFDTDVVEFLKTSDNAFGAPKLVEQQIDLDENFEGSHRDVHRDFYNAIVSGKPVSANGTTGIQGLELANAMIYSNYTGQAVDFPLNREKYAALLADLRAKEAASQ